MGSIQEKVDQIAAQKALKATIKKHAEEIRDALNAAEIPFEGGIPEHDGYAFFRVVDRRLFIRVERAKNKFNETTARLKTKVEYNSGPPWNRHSATWGYGTRKDGTVNVKAIVEAVKTCIARIRDLDESEKAQVVREAARKKAEKEELAILNLERFNVKGVNVVTLNREPDAGLYTIKLHAKIRLENLPLLLNLIDETIERKDS